jgi:hypothetical protein
MCFAGCAPAPGRRPVPTLTKLLPDRAHPPRRRGMPRASQPGPARPMSSGTPAPGGARPRWASGTVDPTPGAGRRATSPARRGSSPFGRAATGPRSGSTPSASDSPHSASPAGSSGWKSGRRPRMVVAHEAEGRGSPGRAQPGPPAGRSEVGPRSMRKNRGIGRDPGSPDRSTSIPLVRPRSGLCAGMSQIFIHTSRPRTAGVPGRPS